MTKKKVSTGSIVSWIGGAVICGIGAYVLYLFSFLFQTQCTCPGFVECLCAAPQSLYMQLPVVALSVTLLTLVFVFQKATEKNTMPVAVRAMFQKAMYFQVLLLLVFGALIVYLAQQGTDTGAIEFTEFLRNPKEYF